MFYVIYLSFVNKNVVIIGGGSGIGVVIVEGFVKQGVCVMFLDIVCVDLEVLVVLLGECVYLLVFCYCDLCDIDVLNIMFLDIEVEVGFIDVLINNVVNDDCYQIVIVMLVYWDNCIEVNLCYQFFCV